MRPRRSQEASRKHLPLASGGSWPPRGPKRPPRRPKRPSRGRQDGPRWPKTPPRRPKTAQVGFKNGAKIEEKSMEKSIENVMRLGIDFWRKMKENRRKMDGKRIQGKGGVFSAVPPFKAGQTPVLSRPPETAPPGL